LILSSNRFLWEVSSAFGYSSSERNRFFSLYWLFNRLLCLDNSFHLFLSATTFPEPFLFWLKLSVEFFAPVSYCNVMAELG
jgi:hypothetical protein